MTIINRRFWDIRIIVLVFLVLIFSVTLISPEKKLLSASSITIPIFILNFTLGYFTVNALVSRGKYFLYRTVILCVLSYGLVPFMAAYVHELTRAWLWGNTVRIWDFFLVVFGVNLIVNTLLLLFYYNSISSKISKKEFPGPKNEEENEYLFFRSNRVLTRIRFDEIAYLEVDGNTVYIQTIKRFFETRMTLGQIMEDLPNNFIQVNKSVIINLSYFEQLIFESETKRVKVKIVFNREDEEMEEIFYVGRKFLSSLRKKLAGE